jgi:Domain of unknown function (DUF4386)
MFTKRPDAINPARVQEKEEIMKEEIMKSKKQLARFAGLLYLIVGISGGFAQSFRQSLIVPDDAAATANNIAQSAMLFRVGFVADLVSITFFLLLAFALYQLLKPVNQQISTWKVFSRTFCT